MPAKANTKKTEPANMKTNTGKLQLIHLPACPQANLTARMLTFHAT